MSDLVVPLHVLIIIICLAWAGRATFHLDREFLAAVVFGGYAIVYGIAPLFLPMSSASFVAALASLATLAGLISGHAIAAKIFGPPTPLALGKLTNQRSMRLVFLVQLIGTAGVYLYAVGSAGSLSAYVESGRFEFRQDPNSQLVMLVGLYLLPFVCAPPLLLMAQRGPQRLMGIVWGIATALSLFFFLKGTRSLAMGLLVAIVVMVVIGRDRPDMQSGAQHRGMRRFLALALAGVAGITLLPNMYQTRHILSSQDVSAMQLITGSNSQGSNGSIFEQDPLNYSLFLQDAGKTFPGSHDYLWAYPIRRIIFFPLPSSATGLKPPDTNQVFADAIGRGSGNTTIPPSLPGEGYVVAGGVIGSALWALIYGLALGWIQARLARPHVTLFALTIGAPMALLALRGQLYELALIALITVTACRIIMKLCRISTKADASNVQHIATPRPSSRGVTR